MSDLSTITPSNWFGQYSEDFLSAWFEKYEGRLVEYFDLPQGLAFGEASDGTRVLYEVASGTVLGDNIEVNGNSGEYIWVQVNHPNDSFWFRIEGRFDIGEAQANIKSLKLLTHQDPNSDLVIKYVPDDTSLYDLNAIDYVYFNESLYLPDNEWIDLIFVSLEENGSPNFDQAFGANVKDGVARYFTSDARSTTLEMSLAEGVTLQSPTWLGPNTEAILTTWLNTFDADAQTVGLPENVSFKQTNEGGGVILDAAGNIVARLNSIYQDEHSDSTYWDLNFVVFVPNVDNSIAQLSMRGDNQVDNQGNMIDAADSIMFSTNINDLSDPRVEAY